MKKTEWMKCRECGMLVEVVEPCLCEPKCELQCCGKPFVRLSDNTTDGAKEKHVPVAVKETGGFRVKVGSVPHPMTEEHHIGWIEVTDDDTVTRKYLVPGAAPEAFFAMELKPGMILREYCNLHGIWSYTVL